MDRIQRLITAMDAVTAARDDGEITREVGEVVRELTGAYAARVVLGETEHLAGPADFAGTVLADEVGAWLLDVAGAEPGPLQGVDLSARAAGAVLTRTASTTTRRPPDWQGPYLAIAVRGEENAVIGVICLVKVGGHEPFTAGDEGLIGAALRLGAQTMSARRDRMRVAVLVQAVQQAERAKTEAIREFAAAADPEDTIDRLLEDARRRLDMDIAYLSVNNGDRQNIGPIVTRPEELPAQSFSSEAQNSLSYFVELGLIARVIRDIDCDPIATGLVAGHLNDYRAGVIAPLVLPDGRRHGSLVCASRTARPDLDHSDLAVAETLAGLIVRELGRSQLSSAHHDRTAALLLPYLRPDGILIELQPIVDLQTGRTVGLEALSRFPERGAGPTEVFRDARAIGWGTRLEAAAAGAALDRLPDVPAGCFLSINLSPEALSDRTLINRLCASDGRRLVVEITEHAPIDNPPTLLLHLAELRAAGVRIAVDDVGAGYATPGHVVLTAPDIIKVDTGLIRHIDTDAMRTALLRAMSTFSTEVGATLVAEGVETEAERDALVSVGIRFAQGYLFGRPV